MVIAFGHFVAAALGAIAAWSFAFSIWMYSDPDFLKQMTREQVANLPTSYTLRIQIAMGLAILGYGVVMGFGLLAARRWALWIAITECSAVCASSLYALISGLVSVDAWELGIGIGAVIFGVEAAAVAFAGALVANLLRRSTRDWFRLADRLRVEHKRGFGSLDRS
jgi:hypothetical protein